ncbi:MAG: hypothetical protein ACFFDK_06210 [Promethearchaeota archaeon]
MKPISKKQSIEVLKEAENYGLVHKVAPVQQNPELEEQTICNCYNCSCGFFQTYKKCLSAFHTLTSYIANANENMCNSCGTCVENVR